MADNSFFFFNKPKSFYIGSVKDLHDFFYNRSIVQTIDILIIICIMNITVFIMCTQMYTCNENMKYYIITVITCVCTNVHY